LSSRAPANVSETENLTVSPGAGEATGETAGLRILSFGFCGILDIGSLLPVLR